jgi:(E)-4-hydroxy-3-methylbut-2-enyl-diphosphate synthase
LLLFDGKPRKFVRIEQNASQNYINLTENPGNQPEVAKNQHNLTRNVKIGSLTIGSDNPIRVQSMTNVSTCQIDSCLAQIAQLTTAGCEIVRLAVPTKADTAALPAIIAQVNIPVVADVHFHYARAIEAIEAGVHKIRLNPGNITDYGQVRKVIDACKANNTAIRVGVNQGSIRPRKENAPQQHTSQQSQSLPELMVEKLTEYVRIFQDANFDNLVLSAKCHNAADTITVYRAVSNAFDYPLHLGVTHSGTVQTGTIRSAVALGTLLAEGIGNTIRVSLAGDPVAEVEVAWEVLTSLRLRPRRGPELIACPSCGRTEIDLLAMAEQVNQRLKEITYPLTVAVMGCIVNGPGEAAEADVALCGGRDKAIIYRQGKKIIVVPAEEAVEALFQQIKIFIAQQSV